MQSANDNVISLDNYQAPLRVATLTCNICHTSDVYTWYIRSGTMNIPCKQCECVDCLYE
jgi:hypothetical protein